MRKRYKIAIVANSSWNVYNFRLNLLKKFKAERLDVVIIAPVDEYIAHLNKDHCDRHIPLKSLSRKSTNPTKDITLIWELYQILTKEKPDVVINYTIKPNIFGNIAAKLAKVKSICVVTGLGYTFLKEGLIRTIANSLYKASFLFADKVIFENQDDKQLFIDKRLVKATKALSVKGCGINTQHYKPEPAPQNTHLTFTFIGRLLYDKGIVEYVNAAKIVKKRYPETKFQVIGELDIENPSTISREQLVEWIDKEYIRYLGTTSDVRQFIKTSDVITLPSYREGLPKVVLEGMAMAKPIITTLTAGCRETVDHGKNGLLVPVKDPEALANAMLTMIEISPEERQNMGLLSRKMAVNTFDDEHITNFYLTVIDHVMTGVPICSSATTSNTTNQKKFNYFRIIFFYSRL